MSLITRPGLKSDVIVPYKQIFMTHIPITICKLLIRNDIFTFRISKANKMLSVS